MQSSVIINCNTSKQVGMVQYGAVKLEFEKSPFDEGYSENQDVSELKANCKLFEELTTDE